MLHINGGFSLEAVIPCPWEVNQTILVLKTNSSGTNNCHRKITHRLSSASEALAIRFSYVG